VTISASFPGRSLIDTISHALYSFSYGNDRFGFVPFLYLYSS